MTDATDTTAAAPDPPAVALPDDEPKEGIELRKDGSAWVWIDGTRYRLRRVRGRDFRHLRDLFTDAMEEVRAEQAALEAWADELTDALLARQRETGVTAALTDDERRENRERSLRLSQLTERLMFEWWAEVFATLEKDGRNPVPAIKPGGDPADMDRFVDVPVWMGSAASAEDLFTHWRSVPSLSGGR